MRSIMMLLGVVLVSTTAAAAVLGSAMPPNSEEMAINQTEAQLMRKIQKIRVAGKRVSTNPYNCHTFMYCAWWGPHEMSCPLGNVWSQSDRSCIQEANSVRTDCQCGEENKQRILGGKQVSPKRKYPWHVGIFVPGDKGFKCSGSIINDQWILTAASCIVKKIMAQNRVIDCQKKPFIEVWVGDHYQFYKYDDISGRKIYRIANYITDNIPHPKYNCLEYRSKYDIGLLKLPNQINFDDIIKPICLPKDKSKDYVGQTGTATGWGVPSLSTSFTLYSKYLKELQLQILDNGKCGKWEIFPPEWMCASHLPGKGPCSGDSGGPFFVLENNKHVQVGVISSVVGCGSPVFPGILTRVSTALDWIIKTTTCNNYYNV